jgi:arylsulfatase
MNDRKVGEVRLEKTCPSRFGSESLDVGMDNGSPVSEDYQPPFAYTGTIKKVEIHLSPGQLSRNDREKIRDAKNKTAIATQ